MPALRAQHLAPRPVAHALQLYAALPAVGGAAIEVEAGLNARRRAGCRYALDAHGQRGGDVVEVLPYGGRLVRADRTFGDIERAGVHVDVEEGVDDGRGRRRGLAADAGQRRAAVEHIGADRRERAGQRDAGQGRTLAEGVLVEGRHALGQGDVRQRGAVVEGARSDFLDALCEVHFAELVAVVKSFGRNFTERGGQGDAFEFFAVAEGVFAQAVHSLGDGDGGEGTIGEGRLAYRAEAGGQFDGGLVVVEESVHADFCYPLGQPEFHGAVSEGRVTDARDALGQREVA